MSWTPNPRRIGNLGLSRTERTRRSARLKLSIKKAERHEHYRAEAEAQADALRHRPQYLNPAAEALQFVRWAEAALPYRLAEGVADWMQTALGKRESGLLCQDAAVQVETLNALLLYFLTGPRVRPAWRGLVASPTLLSTARLRESLATLTEALQPDGLQVCINPYPGAASGRLAASLLYQALDQSHTGHAIGADTVIVLDLDELAPARRVKLLHFLFDGYDNPPIDTTSEDDRPTLTYPAPARAWVPYIDKR